MKRKIDLSSTLATLQNLPVEISLEEVEHWVKHSSKRKQISQKWLLHWLIKLGSWRPFN